jgi:PLP dependent protein
VSDIAGNIVAIRDRISRAAHAAGRSPESIRLVAVSKTFPTEVIEEAIAAGQCCFGENRIQEAEPKITSLRSRHRLEWHLVGHLQSNKAHRAVELFDVVHSLDSARLAARLSKACVEAGKSLSVLIQVDLGQEETKFGADPIQLREIVAAVGSLQGLRLDGLMTLPPFFEDPEMARPYFTRLRELRDALEKEQPGCLGQQHLSMGMSHDFETAIREGATIVRIGTAIFGVRTHA